MKDKHNLYTDYRQLWGSPQSAHDDLIANSHYDWRNEAAGFSAVLNPLDNPAIAYGHHEVVMSSASGILAGDNPDQSIKITHRQHELTQKSDHVPFVISTEGVFF